MAPHIEWTGRVDYSENIAMCLASILDFLVYFSRANRTTMVPSARATHLSRCGKGPGCSGKASEAGAIHTFKEDQLGRIFSNDMISLVYIHVYSRS